MSLEKDLLHRFIFDNTDIRGEIVTLDHSLRDLFSRHTYPESVKPLLGEFVAATALLSSTLKFDGILTLQARGNGPVPIIMAEANHNKHVRGIASLTDTLIDVNHTSLPALIGEGIISITIDPDKGSRYQGIVPMDGPSLADCLEHYFAQSEQLPTRLWLASDGVKASGLLLQHLPQQLSSTDSRQQAWDNRIQLANTITADELLNLPHHQLLTRLFHEEGVRCFEPSSWMFACSCSKHRSSRALTHLGQAEVEQLLAEEGTIEVNCQFCGFQYSYNETDINAIFAPKTQH